MPEESVRSETDITLTVTFNSLNNLFRVSFVHLCVCVCAFPQTFEPYHKIQTNNKHETSALAEFKRSCVTWLADGGKTKNL